MKRFWCWLWGHTYGNWSGWYLRQIHDCQDYLSKRRCLRCGRMNALIVDEVLAESFTPEEIALERAFGKIEEERG